MNDLNWQASDFGLSRWHDEAYWCMYKYAMSKEAIPTVAFNVANIVKALFGKNKKAPALDLDNTLWGGVGGDDGPEDLQLGMAAAGINVCSAKSYYSRERGGRTGSATAPCARSCPRRGYPFDALFDEAMGRIDRMLNDRLPKCLNWRTPCEAFTAFPLHAAA